MEQGEYDFIVVGGGTAGCMVAQELSSIGTVLVLEKGGLMDLSYLNKKFAISHKAKSNKGNLNILVGETLGGCSAINGAVWVTSPSEPYLKDIGLSSVINANWDSLERVLTPQVLTPLVSYPLNDLQRSFNHNLEQEFDLASKDALDQPMCGIGLLKCLFKDGSRTGSHAFIKESKQLTVKLHSKVTQLEVKYENGEYTVTSVVTDNGRFRVKKKVILCCGAYQTPNLLLKSPLAKVNKNIGLEIKEHPMICFSLANTMGNENNPVAFTSFIRSPWAEHAQLPDFQLQFGFNHDREFFFVAFLLESKAKGSLLAGEDFPTVEFDLVPAEDMQKWEWFCGKLAKGVLSKNPIFFEIQQKFEQTSWIASAVCLGQHPCASCLIGGDENSGVVSTSLQMFRTTNVFICDASVLPEPGHANLQSFVYAMALYVTQVIKKSI